MSHLALLSTQSRDHEGQGSNDEQDSRVPDEAS